MLGISLNKKGYGLILGATAGAFLISKGDSLGTKIFTISGLAIVGLGIAGLIENVFGPKQTVVNLNETRPSNVIAQDAGSEQGPGFENEKGKGLSRPIIITGPMEF